MKRSPADNLFSKYIRKRAGYKCQKCGTQHEANSKGLHCAHVFTRGGYVLRFDERNALSLCYPCHTWFDSKATREQKVQLYTDWYGQTQYDEIEKLSKKTLKDFGLTKEQAESEAIIKYKLLLENKQ
jgi:predicted restriction endonuclease